MWGPVAPPSVGRMSESTIDHSGFELVQRYLADHGLEHSIIEHPVTYTAAAEARVAAVEPAHAPEVEAWDEAD